MGNTGSSLEGHEQKQPKQNKSSTNHSQANSSRNRKLGHERPRQQSITSQLFPGRHQARSNLKVQNTAPGTASLEANSTVSQSLFKLDYSLDSTVTGEEKAHLDGSDQEEARLTQNVASLKIDSKSQLIRSPGPSSATVEHSNLEASIPPELPTQAHRPSIVALKQSLIKGQAERQLQAATRARIVGHKGEQLPYVPSATIDIPNSNSSASNTFPAVRDDSSPKSSPMSISTQGADEYIDGGDVVLNESLVENMIKNDMKLKRQLQSHSNSAPALTDGKDELFREATKRAKIPTYAQQNEGLVIPPDSNGKSADNSTLEPPSLFSDANIASLVVTPSTNSGAQAGSVQVMLKWRDTVLDPKTSKVSVISNDISSVLQPNARRAKIPMEYSETEQCWVLPDLKLPAGIYRLQFLINGEVRHSNYLPTATNSISNIVNWFEVVPGYDQIEPYRDAGIDTPIHKDLDPRSDNSSVFTQELPSPAAVRPPLINRGTSSSSRARVIERTNTPISDYTGLLHRAGSSKPVLNKDATGSVDTMPHTSKQTTFTYNSEVPELFKVSGNSNSDEEPVGDDQKSHTPPKFSEEAPSFTHNVQDYNQDELFRVLQEEWKMTAQEAEEIFLEKYPVPDLPVYLNSTYLNEIFYKLQQNSAMGDLEKRNSLTHIIPHVNLNHLLTSSIRDEMISVGCTTRYEGKFITQIMYAPCYYEKHE